MSAGDRHEPRGAEVLVIGSGMAGAAIAARLSAHGVRVVCLEQGPWVLPAEHPHYSNEWEFALQRDWHRSPAKRQAERDYPISSNRVDVMLYNAVGGATTHYNAHWPRLRPSDFRKGTEHGLAGAADWPLSYEELAPYYAQNDHEQGVAGLAGDPAVPPREPRQTRPHPFGPHGKKIAAGLERLGWHWWPADNAILSEDYDGRVGCIQCGSCRNGCPRGSLAMVTRTYWPKALRNGVELRADARVERITVDEQGRADGAVYIDLRSGERYRQRAEKVVLAANGLGSPRLLLLSASGRCPNGLANSSGLVGHHLMHHAYAENTVVFDEPIDGFAGAYGAPIFCQEFAETDVNRGFVNGFTFQIGRGMTASPAALGLPWGAEHRAAFAKFFNHELWFSVQGEDLPVFENRVELDHEHVDSSGLPGVKLFWELHPNDQRLVAYGVERARELAEAAGAVEFRTSGAANPNPAWHLLGTCRMGSDPETSVVDAEHQAWDVPNLYICDGSSFVTGGAVNPTSTIGALALRCADRILARAHSGF
ncbi:MAG TPA: GMC family oxidoreductase [Nitrolancea sp.]|nr:GMC family oxidoreductase [Nitrolancea sp.]